MRLSGDESNQILAELADWGTLLKDTSRARPPPAQVRTVSSRAMRKLSWKLFSSFSRYGVRNPSEIGPAEFRTLAEIEGHVDLSSFKAAFASGDPEIAAEFDRMAGRLVRLVFKEASLR